MRAKLSARKFQATYLKIGDLDFQQQRVHYEVEHSLLPDHCVPFYPWDAFHKLRSMYETDNCDASPPWNFSWVVENELAAMAWPQTEENLNFLWQKGIRCLVTLSPEKIPPIARTKFEWTMIGITEFEAPALNDIVKFIEICEKCLGNKKSVGVHCRMGRGRTGVMAACFLVHFHDMPPETAIGKLRLRRPGSVETFEQQRAVHRYHDYLRGTKIREINNVDK